MGAEADASSSQTLSPGGQQMRGPLHSSRSRQKPPGQGAEESELENNSVTLSVPSSITGSFIIKKITNRSHLCSPHYVPAITQI